MNELLQVASALTRASREEETSVLATVVRTVGSTYRRIGARLVAFADGSYVGSVSAGCIESDVLLRVDRVRSAGAVELVTYDTRAPEDLLWGSGTACGGMSQLLLEPLDSVHAAAKAERLRHVAQLRGWSALATVIRASGLPLQAGDQAVLPHADARLTGFDGLSPQARMAVEATARHQLRAWSSTAEVHAWADTELEIAYEVRSPRLRFCVCGAGRDASPLVSIAKLMGWQVSLIDHRPTMLSPERWPGVECILLGSADEAASAVQRADCDAAVVMSHNYELDVTHLGALLAAGVPYIGVLGPRRRTTRMVEELGLREVDAARLHAPVGLDIGAETPEEIALAIAAEVQAVTARCPGTPLRGRTGAIHREPLTIESMEPAAMGCTR